MEWRLVFRIATLLFFFDGIAINVLNPPFPRQVVVGTLVPMTIPCPSQWVSDRRLVTKAVSEEFCSKWKKSYTLGKFGGIWMGWLFLSRMNRMLHSG